jgi:hypothetical protein
LYQLVIYGFYPLWLLAGAADYLCHRRTHIERTAGVHESWLHIAQFVTIVLIAAGLALFAARGAVLFALVVLVVVHTALSYVDVRYTQPRRFISPAEQHAHAFMDVLPLAAVAVIAVLDSEAALDSQAATLWRQPALTPMQLTALLGSLLVLGGIPVVEEMLRTRRASTQEGLATIK